MMSRFRPGSQPRRCSLGSPNPNNYTDPEGPIPSRPRLSSEKSSRKPAETLARDPEKARSRPRTRTNLRVQAPELTPKTDSSPRTGCVVLFYRILCIFFYILCVMFNNVYIWCYVHHSRLSQTLEFRQFFSDLLFCLCCYIFLYNVLFVDK